MVKCNQHSFFCVLKEDDVSMSLRKYNIYVDYEMFGKTHVRKRPSYYYDVGKQPLN